MDTIEVKQSNRHFTTNEGDAGDAASSRYFFKPQVTKTKSTMRAVVPNRRGP
jgi:hypothetical protein